MQDARLGLLDAVVHGDRPHGSARTEFSPSAGVLLLRQTSM
jgi:hypothetical protein